MGKDMVLLSDSRKTRPVAEDGIPVRTLDLCRGLIDLTTKGVFETHAHRERAHAPSRVFRGHAFCGEAQTKGCDKNNGMRLFCVGVDSYG